MLGQIASTLTPYFSYVVWARRSQVTRSAAASAAVAAIGGIEAAQLIPIPQDMNPGRVQLTRLGSDMIAAWMELPKAGTSPPPRVRVSRVSNDGELILDTGPSFAAPTKEGGITLAIDDDRAVVTWAEVGDTALADNVPGRSRVRILRLAANLQGPAVETKILSTKYYTFGPPRTIARAAGQLLTLWGARSLSSGREVVYGARLDCKP